MDAVSLVLDFASLVNFVGVLLLTRAIIRDRNVLKGFSVSGSLLTFIAVSGFDVAYFLMGNLIGFSLGLANIVFWLIAFMFALRRFIHQRPTTK
jgi:hypothetical protein